MSKKFVSIIIPMYNAEATIIRCLKSIQEQTYSFLDIIVIDDGSLDQSVNLVKNLAKHDVRIQIHTQSNQGPSHARNKGLELAMGRYIQFVDADDWIENTMVEQLLMQMNHPTDLVICGYRTESKKVQPIITGIYSKENWLPHIGELYEQTILPSPCNKLYKKDIIHSANITFQTDYSLGEDLLFNIAYLTICDTIVFISTTPYVYCYEATSLTRKYVPDLFSIQLQLHEHFKTFLTEQQCTSTANENAANHVFIHGVSYAIGNIYHPRSPLHSKQKYNALREIILDKSVQQVSSSAQGILRYALFKKRIRFAHILFQCKGFLKQIHHYWRQRI